MWYPWLQRSGKMADGRALHGEVRWKNMEDHKSRLGIAGLIALIVFTMASGAAQAAPSLERGAAPPPSVRLYVLNCGTLHIADLGRFGLKKDEVATSDLSVPCFLVVHPQGTLIWDTGGVPDADWQFTRAAVTHHVVPPDSQERDVTMIKPLKMQLAARGSA